MQILITHGSLARTRVLRLNRLQVVSGLAVLVLAVMLMSAGIYHLVFVKAVRDGWPGAARLAGAVLHDDDGAAARERFMRENLDAMARRLGEMQAKLVRLQAMGERVSGLAGLKFEELAHPAKPAAKGARAEAAAAAGGPFIAAVPAATPMSLDALEDWVGMLDEQADLHADLFILMESRLLEDHLQQMMVPSTAPVAGAVGSGFGIRSDPFTGRAAVHTGLDFPANTGTPIVAAASGVVLWSGRHPQYGLMVELDHGKGLVTRYAHASRLLVATGDFVKRGETIARVGSTGRSTGPHLHFEVLLNGAHQNPARFLAGKAAPAVLARHEAR